MFGINTSSLIKRGSDLPATLSSCAFSSSCSSHQVTFVTIYVMLISKAIANGTPVREAVANVDSREWFDSNFQNRKYRVRQTSRPLMRSAEPAIRECEKSILAYFAGNDAEMPRVREVEIEPVLDFERQLRGRVGVACDADQLCRIGGTQEKVMCVRCRKFFHAKCKTMSGLARPWPSSRFCEHCKPSSTFEFFNPPECGPLAIGHTPAGQSSEVEEEGTKDSIDSEEIGDRNNSHQNSGESTTDEDQCGDSDGNNTEANSESEADP